MRVTRAAAALGLATALCLMGPARGQQVPVAAVQDPAVAEALLELTADHHERMTVPVSIEGKGPFRFVVDTGAERTSIARELAQDLELSPGRIARLTSITETSLVQTAVIPALEVGGNHVREIHAPLLERRHLGAEGVLGVDMLQDQRVSFDFKRQQMRITPSRRREEHWSGDEIIVKARSKFGYLVLVDAWMDGQKVFVIIDTGAQITLGNPALRDRLARKNRLKDLHPVTMFSVTGGRAVVDQTVARRITIDKVDIRDMPIAFADAQIFRALDLEDRPAMLLGMDALQLFDRVSVDFAKRRVRLLSGGRSQAMTPVRHATRKAARPAGSISKAETLIHPQADSA